MGVIFFLILLYNELSSHHWDMNILPLFPLTLAKKKFKKEAGIYDHKLLIKSIQYVFFNIIFFLSVLMLTCPLHFNSIKKKETIGNV